MRIFTSTLILLICACSLNAQDSPIPRNNIKNKISIESQFMFANTYGEFFPVYNNDFSITYGIMEFASIGLFHDRYWSKFYIQDEETVNNSDLLGIRISLSVIPIVNKSLEWTLLYNFDLNITSSFSYHTGIIYVSPDKKDQQEWIQYYKVGIKYYLNNNLFLSGSAGLINTNRFYLGIGIKY